MNTSLVKRSGVSSEKYKLKLMIRIQFVKALWKTEDDPVETII